MWAERTNILTQKVGRMDLNVTLDQMDRFNRRYMTHEKVQDIFPDLPAPEREFLISGIKPDEWVAEFGTGDDEDRDLGNAMHANKNEI